MVDGDPGKVGVTSLPLVCRPHGRCRLRGTRATTLAVLCQEGKSDWASLNQGRVVPGGVVHTMSVSGAESSRTWQVVALCGAPGVGQEAVGQTAWTVASSGSFGRAGG